MIKATSKDTLWMLSIVCALLGSRKGKTARGGKVRYFMAFQPRIKRWKEWDVLKKCDGVFSLAWGRDEMDEGLWRHLLGCAMKGRWLRQILVDMVGLTQKCSHEVCCEEGEVKLCSPAKHWVCGARSWARRPKTGDRLGHKNTALEVD